MNNIDRTLASTREASRQLLATPESTIAAMLAKLADETLARTPLILEANALDLARMNPELPDYDRLRLTPERIEAIAADIRNVASLPSPVGTLLEQRTLPNGLELRKVSVPFGVVGVVYEARPNVTFDVATLCLRSGNACVLKGGSAALNSNRAIVDVIHSVMPEFGIPTACVELIEGGHDATQALIRARGLVDLVIPRGGRKLIDTVRQNALVPVIETGAGVCHAYFHADGNLEMGTKIIENAKTRRVSVCNALDCLLIDRSRLGNLPAICKPLADAGVRIEADPDALLSLEGTYPEQLLTAATPDSFGTEFRALAMAVKCVDNLTEAIDHINRFGSGHSETIITDCTEAAERFSTLVDAACVYTNAPTSWTDGAQFGLGAEIGISTQKLHARGPMGLAELNTYKWLISGHGQLRPR